MKCAQHAAHCHPKFEKWDYSDIPGDGHERLKDQPTLHRLISAAVSQWMTSDPAELPIVPGREKLCTSAVEYNPKVSKGKTPVSVRFIIKIQHIYVIHIWLLRDTKCFFVFLFFLNVVIEKMVYVMNHLQKGEQWQRRLLAWRLGPTYISEVGHHLITPPTPTYGRGEGSLPNSFGGEFILFIKTHFYRRALTSHFIYISYAVLWSSDMGSHGIFRHSTRHSCPISNCWTRSNLAQCPTLITIPWN